MDAVPEDNLVHGDHRRRTVLPPADVVLGDDAPWRVVLAPNVIAEVTEHHVIGGRGISLGRQVSDVVRLGEVVPCQQLDDVRLNGVVAD